MASPDPRFSRTHNLLARAGSPDYGAMASFWSSIGASWDLSVAGTVSRAGKYFLADALDENILSKEDFDARYAYKGGPTWYEGMTESGAELRLEDWQKDNERMRWQDDRHFMPNLVAGFLGQAADPTNYIGYGLASLGGRLALKTGMAGLAGRAMVAASEIINPTPFNVEAKLALAGQRAMGRIGNTFLTGLTEAELQIGGIYGFSRYTQQQYGTDEALADALGAGLIAGAFGIGRGAFRHLNRTQKDLTTDAVLQGATNGETSLAQTKAALASDAALNEMIAASERRQRTVANGELLNLNQLDEMAREAAQRGDAVLLPEFHPEGAAGSLTGAVDGLYMALYRSLSAIPDSVKPRRKLVMVREVFRDDGKPLSPERVRELMEDQRLAEEYARFAADKADFDRKQEALHLSKAADDIAVREWKAESDAIMGRIRESKDLTPEQKQRLKEYSEVLDTLRATEGEGRTLADMLRSVFSRGGRITKKRMAEFVRQNTKANTEHPAARTRAETTRKRPGTVKQLKAQKTLTDDAAWLADLYRRSFGVEVRFFDDATADQVGALGFFGPSTRDVIYIRSGALLGKVDSMMTIAGHELFHSIRLNHPTAWLAMSDAITAAGSNPVVRDAYARTKAALETPGAPSMWGTLPVSLRLDEVFATINGRAMQTPEYWKALWNTAPDDARVVQAELQKRLAAVKASGPIQGKIRQMVTDLGAALALSVGQKPRELSFGQHVADWEFFSPPYAARHIDFLKLVSEDVTREEYRSILEDSGPYIGEGDNRRPMTLEELDNHLRDLVDTDPTESTASPERAPRLVDESSGATRGRYERTPIRLDRVYFDQPDWQRRLAIYLVHTVFKGAKEGTLERRIYDAWVENSVPGRKGWAKPLKALQSFTEDPENVSLLRLTRGEDGSVEVSILKNDDRPSVSIPRETQKQIESLWRSEALGEFDDAVTDMFTALKEILWVMRKDREGKLTEEDIVEMMAAADKQLAEGTETTAAIESPLLLEFINSNEGYDVLQEWLRWKKGEIKPGAFTPAQPGKQKALRSYTDNIYDAFLNAFREFTAEKAARNLDPSDLTLAESLRDLDVLLQHRTNPPGWAKLKEKWEKTGVLARVQKAQEKVQAKAEAFLKEKKKEMARMARLTPKEVALERDPAEFQAKLDRLIGQTESDLRVDLVLRTLIAPRDKDGNFIDTSAYWEVATDPDGFQGPRPGMDVIEQGWRKLVAKNPWLPRTITTQALDLVAMHPALGGVRRTVALNRAFNKKLRAYDLKEAASAKLPDDEMFVPIDTMAESPELSTADFRDSISFMARLADETPEAAASRALDYVAEAEASRVLKIADLERLASERLASEHRNFQGWVKDYEQSASAQIAAQVESLIGFSGFDPLQPAAKLRKAFSAREVPPSPADVRLFEDLMLDVASMKDNLDTLKVLARNKNAETDSWVGAAFERHKYRLNGDKDGAVAATRQDIVRESLSRMTAKISNHEAGGLLRRLHRDGPAMLKNFIDGLVYKGTRLRADNVASARVAARERAQGALVLLLESVEKEFPGFREQWLTNKHTRNIELHRHGQLKEKVNPEVLRTYDRIIQRLDQINETLIGEANANGANITPIDRYLWSQVHRGEKIRARGEAAFVADLNQMIDHEATKRMHGPGWEFNEWAKAFYHEVTDQSQLSRSDYDPDLSSNPLGNPYGSHRVVIFKPGSAFDYDMKYGSGNTASLIMGQIGGRAERIALMRKLGTNYEQNWNQMLAEAGGPGPKFHDLWVADQTFRLVAGQLDHPFNARIAAYGRAVRNWMNSAVGWMSGVSSLTDIAMLKSQLRFMGGDAALRHRSLTKALLDAGAPGERAAWLRGNGAGLQTLIQSYSRILEADGWFINFAQSASNFTFKYNGLEVMNRAVQGAYFDISTQILGDNVKAQSPEFKQWLAANGISEGEWKQMAPFARMVDGLENLRLSPEMIPDIQLSRKLHTAMRSSMDYALLQPSASTEALLRMGTQSGTWTGEALRCITQFKGYPIDMVRRIVRRFNNGYAQNALMERVIWGYTIIGLSLAALSLKDMARGTEPLNPFDMDQWNFSNVMRVLDQATVGPFAMLGQFGSMEQVLGPAPGSIYGLFAADSTYGRTAAVLDMTPGATAWVGPRRALMSWIAPQALGEPIETMYAWRHMETGQGRLLESD